MTSARTWVGILGFVIMAVMLAYKERSAFICGIGLITVIRQLVSQHSGKSFFRVRA
jgi:xanthine/uracil/vitamin C permease (AzgA family)